MLDETRRSRGDLSYSIKGELFGQDYRQQLPFHLIFCSHVLLSQIIPNGEKSNYKNFCQTFWSGSFELPRARAGQLQTALPPVMYSHVEYFNYSLRALRTLHLTLHESIVAYTKRCVIFQGPFTTSFYASWMHQLRAARPTHRSDRAWVYIIVMVEFTAT
jgi:hypothetical protein